MQLNFLTILLADAPAPPGSNPTTMIFIMAAMIVVMYFFMIRPQAKRAKEEKSFADSIANGEQIVTTAGIHGRINRINEDGTMQLEISRSTFMTIDRSAVSMQMTQAFRKKSEAAATVTTPATTK